MELALDEAGLAGEQFDEFADRHARGEAVRVHDHVGTQAQFGERQVLLFGDERRDALLTVARAELVADLGPARLPQQDLDDGRLLVVARHHHLAGATKLAVTLGSS